MIAMEKKCLTHNQAAKRSALALREGTNRTETQPDNVGQRLASM